MLRQCSCWKGSPKELLSYSTGNTCAAMHKQMTKWSGQAFTGLHPCCSKPLTFNTTSAAPVVAKEKPSAAHRRSVSAEPYAWELKSVEARLKLFRNRFEPLFALGCRSSPAGRHKTGKDHINSRFGVNVDDACSCAFQCFPIHRLLPCRRRGACLVGHSALAQVPVLAAEVY